MTASPTGLSRFSCSRRASGLNLNILSSWVTSPSVPAGTNYALAGATSWPGATNGTPAISLPAQVGAFSLYSGGSADPNALYVIMIGGNDVRDAALYGHRVGRDGCDHGRRWHGVGRNLDAFGRGRQEFPGRQRSRCAGSSLEFTLENPGTPRTRQPTAYRTTASSTAGLQGLGLPAGDRRHGLRPLCFQCEPTGGRRRPTDLPNTDGALLRGRAALAR